MLLALRKSPPSNANALQRVVSWLIKARLVSQYCHGGIVIDGTLYHANAAHGLHAIAPGEWSPDNWDIFDVGGDDAAAIRLFDEYVGSAYDWFGLLAFVGITARDAKRFYCYEWCYLARTGRVATTRVTPETLLTLEKHA